MGQVTQLSKRIENLRSEENLPAMIVDSLLLPNIVRYVEWDLNMQNTAHMTQALFGAYISEVGGDFYSILKLYEYFTDLGKEDFTRCLMKAVQCLIGATPSYKGRTATVLHFSQVRNGDSQTLEVE